MDQLEAAKERRNALRREQYALDGGKRAASNQAWKDAHRAQVREAGREYMKARRASGDTRLAEQAKRWRKANPEKVKEMARAWREANPEYHKKYSAKSYRKDPRRFLLANCKIRAGKKGLPFALTIDDIPIPGACPVLGLTIVVGGGGFQPNSPSIDRVVPELGYVPGNVVVISWRANVLKRDGTAGELEKIAAYIRARGGT